MGLFGFGKSKKQAELVSPLTGEVIPVEQCPDAVFAGKILGDGIAVTPTDGKVYAPMDGTVIQLSHTFHAFCIAADDGAELLIHLGMDTVNLEGKGFTCYMAVGQKVKKGDLVMEMDLPFIESQGISTVSPCIITNTDAVGSLKALPGKAEGGKTVVLMYQMA